MTAHTVQEVAAYWVAAGGPADRRVEWVAIAEAESSLDDAADSFTGAIGLWQIEFFNAGIGGGTIQQLYDPEYNAHVAVIMSGGGTNCAAWDTCYANIAASGRYRYLAYPENGSAAWNNIPAVSSALGVDTIGGGLPGPSPSLDSGAGQAIADVQQLTSVAIPALDLDLLITALTVDQIYTRGWKPYLFS